MKNISILICILFMFAQIGYSQAKINHSVVKNQKNTNTTLQILKDIALCKCIENGYKLDSLNVEDASAWILIGGTNCDMGPLFALDSLTKKFVDTLPTLIPGADEENGRHKRIASSCIELYKSKRLEAFIKYLMKESCNTSPPKINSK
jgi:hypothetical protein